MNTIADRADVRRRMQARCRCPACGGTSSGELFEFEWDGEEDSEVQRSSSAYIQWVQQALNRLLGAKLVVDGISGTLTKSALRSFQSKKGLGVDGIVGPITEAALIAAGAGQPPGYSGTPVAPPVGTPAPVTPPRSKIVLPESALTSLLPTFAGYTYSLDYPRYPWPLPGVSVPLAPPASTNCCCFAEALIVTAAARHVGPGFRWSSALHGLMMIPADFSDRYSPITAMVQSGLGTAIADGAAPAPWSLVQGWRSSTGGHTMIIVAHHVPSDRVLTLEANSAFGLNGVGCRNFGNLRDLPGGRPPPRWWEDSRAPTWSQVRSGYAYGLRMARLGVTGLSWAGQS